MLRNKTPSNCSYYVTETRDGTFAVIERQLLNHAGSHRSEHIVGEYRREEDADAHLRAIEGGLWRDYMDASEADAARTMAQQGGEQ